MVALIGSCGDPVPGGDDTDTATTTGDSNTTQSQTSTNTNTGTTMAADSGSSQGSGIDGSSTTDGTGTTATSADSSTTTGSSDESTGTTGGIDYCATAKATVTPLVQVPHPDGGTYGIDATEVTRAQYCVWLQADPDPSVGQPSSCGWNDTFGGGYWPDAPDGADLPITYVDWCDAHAYCEGVGKRLCGHVDGGANSPSAPENAQTSQWYRACSQGGVNDYPYGAEYQFGVCNDAKNGGDLLDVGSMPSCQPSGDYAGVFDLNGNVDEWEDSCSVVTPDGNLDNCYVRGGSYGAASAGNRCSWAAITDRSTRTINVGFRCCEAS